MLSRLNNNLVAALYLAYRHNGGINPLIELLAKKQLRIYPQIWNFSFNRYQLACHFHSYVITTLVF